METQKTAAVEIPDFDFAKVGKKRERKGGAFLWLSGGGAKGFAGRLLSEIVSNIGVFALVGAVGAGAWGYGKAMAPEYEKYQAEQKAKTEPKKVAKQKPKYEGDLSNLAGPRKAREDSVGMISGSLDGKTPEERAAEAAAAAKKAQEEAEAQAKADAAAEEPMPDVPGVDPNAMAGAAEEEVPQNDNAPDSKGMAKKYGALSTSLGGSSRLAGGAGMSGGSGKAFDAPKFKADKGKLLAMRSASSTAGRAKSGSVASFRSSQRSLARRQADKARHFSNLAKKGNNETRSSLASTAFDNNKPAGEYVTGAGEGAGGNGGQGADGSPAPNQPSGGGGGGALGDMGSVDAPSPVANVAGRSVDPTDKIVMILKMLMMMIAMIAIVQFIFTKLLVVAVANASKVASPDAPWWAGVAKFVLAKKKLIMKTLLVLGLVVAALGIVLMTMGRMISGSIYTVIGLGTALYGWKGNPAASYGWQLLLVAGTNTVMPFMDTGRKYDQASGKWAGG